MKRFLAFLLLFGVGLAIVLVLQGRSPREEPAVTLPGVPEPDRERPRVHLGGALSYTAHATEGTARPALFRLEAEDSGRPEGAAPEVWLMQRVRITTFDPETGAETAHITADSARGELLPNAGGGPAFEIGSRVFLEGVAGAALSGGPLAPLTFEVATADADLAERTFSSKDPARLAGTRIEATGTGLVADLEERRFELLADARAGLRTEEGRTVSLASTGALVLRELASGVEVDALGDARLVLTGDDASSAALEGQRVTLLASHSAERTYPTAAHAEDARVRVGESATLGGARAHLTFEPTGAVALLTLEGEPWAEYAIAAGTEFLPGLATEERGDVLRLSGPGPLEVEPPTSVVRLESGGTLTVSGMELTASERIGLVLPGPAPADEQPGLRATGDVLLVRQGWRLETHALWVARADEGDLPVVRAEALGGSVVSATGPAGEPLLLRTQERLEFRVSEGVWTVPWAGRVELERGGSDPLTAQARVVRDLDPEKQTFAAEGDIWIQGLGGQSFRGSSLVAAGPGSMLVTGAPAVYAAHGVYAEAERIERLGPEEVRAHGGVRARLSDERGRADLATEELYARREALASDEHVTFLEARGNVAADLALAGSAQAVSAEELTGRLRSRTTADGELWLEAHIEAHGDVHATLERDGEASAVESASVVLDYRLDEASGAEQAALFASGDVRFETGPAPRMVAEAGSLRLDETGRGRLESAGGRRAHAAGTLPDGRSTFEVDAEWIDFSREHFEARDISGSLSRPTVTDALDEAKPAFSDMRGRAGHMRATHELVELAEGVQLSAGSADAPTWRLQSGSARFVGRYVEELPEQSELSDLEAWSDVVLDLGEHGWVAGEHLVGRTSSGALRVEGAPARLVRGGLAWESSWIELDLDLSLPRSGAGRLLQANTEDPSGPPLWELEYLTLETLVLPDQVLQAFQSPVGRSGTLETRASWAVLWIDRRGWAELASRDLRQLEVDLAPSEQEVPATGFFRALAESALGGVLQELYLEGPVELLDNGDRLVLAEAFYVDALDGHGWIANMDLNLKESVFGKESVVLHADWVRHSADGSLRADDAIVTTCEFEDRHVYVRTRDLRVEPVAGQGRVRWDVEMHGNSIHLFDWIVLPLPTIYPLLDDQGDVLPESLRLGRSGRLGNFLEAVIERDLGDVGKVANKALGGDPDRSRARYRVRGSYLGSRGVMLDLSARLESVDRYWWSFHVGGLSDSSEDGGLVQVPADERHDERIWYRSRGRFELGRGEWLELAYSDQTDPGVQAEFWEKDYLAFEERETDVHWRKAFGPNYLHARAVFRTDDFRTQVEELPELGFTRLPVPLLHLGRLPVLYGVRATAARLRRREGDPAYEAPFADGFGEREVLRLDTAHRLEAPFALGVGGLRATPFAEARGTVWDQDVLGLGNPTRAALVAGVRVATTFWRTLANGGLHQLSPYLEARRDVLLEERNGVPVPFDEIEDPLAGAFLDLGLRGRWFGSGGGTLDLELAATHANDVAPGEDDGWLPLAARAGLRTRIGDIPVAVYHDGRYELEDFATPYSSTSVGFVPAPPWAVEVGHRRGILPDGTNEFEAATLAARYRWSPKWELEARHSISLSGTGSLETSALIRRFGHDLVFELEVGRRPGEGGTSISIDLKPLLGWKPSELGVIDY